ncbi:MAG: hypothetical protein KGJ41_13985 [Rhodospirillales bacterium]|nr:hypothetical protein [Rhodospirillales bacterium]MDE2574729.1 hypothetical protein [Rhodospirillales bacterium]
MPQPDAPDPALPAAIAPEPAPEAAHDAARGAAALAGQVATLLRVARSLVQARRAIDLTGLDGMVGQLCARALDLPPAQGCALRPLLVALLGDLDALQAAQRPP